jgi:hypothetical protein
MSDNDMTPEADEADLITDETLEKMASMQAQEGVSVVVHCRLTSADSCTAYSCLF